MSDFSKLTSAYEKAPNKSKAWEKIEGSRVTWTGKVVQSNSTRIYVMQSDKYFKNTSWNAFEGTKNAYYVFVAKGHNFKQLEPGQTVTITGKLTSRGDLTAHANWDVTLASIEQ